MTRDEAIKLASGGVEGNFVASDVVVILERLGLLKFDQPKTATDRVVEVLNRHIMASGGAMVDSTMLCAIMNKARARIVDQS